MHAYGSDKPFRCKWGCCVLKRFRMKSPSVKHRARQRGKREIERAMAEGM